MNQQASKYAAWIGRFRDQGRESQQGCCIASHITTVVCELERPRLGGVDWNDLVELFELVNCPHNVVPNGYTCFDRGLIGFGCGTQVLNTMSRPSQLERYRAV